MTKKLLASILLACTVSLMGQSSYEEDRIKARSAYCDTVDDRCLGVFFGVPTGRKCECLMLVMSRVGDTWTEPLVTKMMKASWLEWHDMGFKHVKFVSKPTAKTPKSRLFIFTLHDLLGPKEIPLELYHEERIP